MRTIKQTEIKKNELFFTKEKISTNLVEQKEQINNIHHLFIIDCSGSMWNELFYIRKDLYNRISTSLREGDSVSIIWFSGKNEYGVLVDSYNIYNSDVSINGLRKLINTHLTPRGLTAFCEPIDEARSIINSDIERGSKNLYSLFFITDGYDNGWSEREILQSVERISDKLASATIVEYGYYCNKDLLNKMATKIGGNHIFAEDFQDYQPYINNQFNQTIKTPRIYVRLSGHAIDGFCFSYNLNGDVISYQVNEDNEIFIDPNTVGEIFYMTNTALTSDYMLTQNDFAYMSQDIMQYSEQLKPYYAAMVAYSKKNDFNTVSNILRLLGDVYFIKKKSNTFGAQKINELENSFSKAIADVSKMFREGYNPDLEPKEDAYCVMNLLDDLMSSDENKWYPSLMNYKRMSRKTELKGFDISAESKEEVENLISENNIDAAIKKLEEIKNSIPQVVEFVNEDKEKGFPISSITWNNKRANLSVQVKYNGHIILPENDFNLPEKFETHIYRNYNIIKDGVVHSYVLPVSLNEETFRKIKSNGLLAEFEYSPTTVYKLNFSSLPVVNQKMIKNSSAEELFKNHYNLLKLKAKNSVYNYFKKEYLKGYSKTFIDLYGSEATEWLKEHGITANGFNPKVVRANTTESAVVNTLEVKVDKLASLPSARDVVKKLNEGKDLTDREIILKPYIDEFNIFYESVSDIPEEKRISLIENWIDSKSSAINKEKRRLENEISKTKFLTIIGKSWFKDLSSREDKELILEIDDKERRFILEDKMETIEI